MAAAFAPLLHPAMFLLSLALLVAAFVLAIVSIVRGKVGGGIILLAGVFISFFASCSALVDRDKILHHPEQLRSR